MLGVFDNAEIANKSPNKDNKTIFLVITFIYRKYKTTKNCLFSDFENFQNDRLRYHGNQGENSRTSVIFVNQWSIATSKMKINQIQDRAEPLVQIVWWLQRIGINMPI